MKIALDEIREVPRSLAYLEAAEPLNRELARGAGDFQVAEALAVELAHRRAGLEVFVEGMVRAEVRGRCARCLSEYRFPLEVALDVVLAPASAAEEHPGALRDDEIGLAYYEGEEVDLTPLVHEHTLVALPSRALCSEACRGLCSRCGANQNAGPCDCPAPVTSGRLSALHTMLRSR